jgi:translation initiation factor 1
MSKKKRATENGIVYSTNPEFEIREESEESITTLAPADQRLTVRLETKHRAGKAVSLVKGFVGTESDLEDLGKKLKNFCGTGGSVKDGEVIIQGDQREKILQWLIKNQYTKTRKF